MYEDTSILKVRDSGTRVYFAGQLTTPDAAGYSIILDTTNDYPKAMVAPPKSATLPTPGDPTAAALGKLVCLNVSCTGQNVTVQRYGLHGDEGWHLFAEDTVTAGDAARSIVWDPSGYGYADALIVALAGGVAPGALYCDLIIRDLAWR